MPCVFNSILFHVHVSGHENLDVKYDVELITSYIYYLIQIVRKLF